MIKLLVMPLAIILIIALRISSAVIGWIYSLLPAAEQNRISSLFHTPFASKLPTLVTIGFSHYSEKARWALDLIDPLGQHYEEIACSPATYMFRTLLYTSGKSQSCPLFITPDKKVLMTSQGVIQYCSDECEKFGAISLYPNEDTRLMEKYMDDVLGPHSRRWFYSYVLLEPRNSDFLKQLFGKHGTSEWEKILQRNLHPYIRDLVIMSQGISLAGRERSLKKIQEVFNRVNTLLSDGRKYLCNTETLSAADITFAALAYPLILPPQLNLISMEFDHKLVSEDMYAEIEKFRASPAGKYVLNMYEKHRGTSLVRIKDRNQFSD